MPKKKKPVARLKLPSAPRAEVTFPKPLVAAVMRGANAKAAAQRIKPPLTWMDAAAILRASNAKAAAQRTKPPLTWMDAERLIEAEMKRVAESPDWSTRQQEPGYLRALLLLRRHRRNR